MRSTSPPRLRSPSCRPSRLQLGFPLLVLPLLTACPEQQAPSPTTTASISATASAPASPAALPAPCDAYVAKMRTCIEKLPEAEREPRKKVLEESIATFREQARRPETRANVETTCTHASAAIDADPLCK